MADVHRDVLNAMIMMGAWKNLLTGWYEVFPSVRHQHSNAKFGQSAICAIFIEAVDCVAEECQELNSDVPRFSPRGHSIHYG